MGQKIADQIHDVEDFGDLPRPLLDQLSRILSKRRAINSHTFNFFLHPEHEEVAIYDAAGGFPLLGSLSLRSSLLHTIWRYLCE